MAVKDSLTREPTWDTSQGPHKNRKSLFSYDKRFFIKVRISFTPSALSHYSLALYLTYATATPFIFNILMNS